MPRRLHIDCDPRRFGAIGDAFGVAHHLRRIRPIVDAHENALAGRPGRALPLRLAQAAHLLVNAIGCASHGEFAQRGKIAWGEIIADGALRLLGRVDLALLQTLDQLLRRKINQFDVISAIEQSIRYSFAHANARDAGDDVVQAFEVLNVERRPDIDACRKQLFNIHPAFGMA